MEYETKTDCRTWAEIDMAALLHNFNYVRELTKKPVMCVIKADAYGHGAVECGKFLEKHGAAAFAVACLDEAVELRQSGIKIPILILSYTSAQYAGILAKYDITQALVDLEHAREMNDEAKKAGVTVKCHIKTDTGMGRVGLLAHHGEENTKKAIDDACRECEMSNLDVKGLFTHMSVADTPSQIEYTKQQIRNYNAVREGIIARGHTLECCHMANSAGIMNLPETHFDMVREGIILYGMYPDSVPVENGVLKPVMTLKSRVAQVRDMPADSSVGYGRTYISDKPITTAVITAGYADGYSRRQSNQATVVINGQKCRQIGRVCMDMIMADVTGKNVKRDDEVILFGNGGLNLEEVSQIVGTINYELTCLVTRRARRLYINRD